MGFFDKKQPPKPQQIQVSTRVTGGRIHEVKCPWCGNANDLRGVGPDGSNLLDNGAEFDCDSCRRIFQVVKIEKPIVISVRQHPTKHYTVKDPTR